MGKRPPGAPVLIVALLPQPGVTAPWDLGTPKASVAAPHPLQPTFYRHLPPGKLKAMAPLPDSQCTSPPTTPSPDITSLSCLGFRLPLPSFSFLGLSASLCFCLSCPPPSPLPSLLLRSLRNTRSLDGLMYLVLTKAFAKKVV